MGGFGGLGEVVFKGLEKYAAPVAEKLASKVATKVAGPAGAAAVDDLSKEIVQASGHFFSMDSSMTGESGKYLNDMIHKQFIPEFDKRISINTKLAQDTSKLPPGHPFKNVHPTELPHLIRGVSRNEAKANVFGKNGQILAGLIRAIADEHGPLGPEKAASVVDQLGVFFHESAYGPSGHLTSDTAQKLSKFKSLEDINFRPSSYMPPRMLERGITKGAVAALAPKAGIPHSMQGITNGLLNARASSLVKAMGEILGNGYAASKAQLIASDAFGHGLLDEMSQVINSQNGVYKYLPGSVAEFVHKNWMIPGLSAVRNFGMVYSGMTGKIEAEQAAWALANGHPKRGILALDMLGINYKDVEANNGKLTKDQLEMAMRSMIQRNMFLEQGTARTPFASAGPLGRILTMFHGFGSNMGNLVFRSTMRNLGQFHDPAMFMQQIATLAVAFPTVGNALYSIEQAAMGRDMHPIDSFGEREKGLYSGEAFANTVEAISHMVGFGIITSYARAAARDKLVNAMAGPIINSAGELVMSGVKAHNSDTEHGGDQFKRNLLHDIPSFGIGSVLANTLYPTKAQRYAEQPKTIKQIKAARARARHKRKREY